MSLLKTSRSTQAKKSILDLIEQSSIALTHADIQEQLDGLCNRVTIYRVLDRLLEEEMIHKLIDMDGITKYMACIECEDEHEHAHHHVHFSCQQCGQLSCLHHVVPTFKLPKGYQIEEVNFTISGCCPNCKVT
ncbi:MAG: Fur family ferric uptake transcriptional regulator [Chitinophagales bacterium]|jgi:Fur family ferric uptake transcriptional regulator|tara:strand:- start:362 stop:760 length:399 start_codon:yes stop_codon:yes gene_type:complete